MAADKHPDERAALAWRTVFIRMPYARELTVPLSVINDTFETAVTWDRFEAFHSAVSTATGGSDQGSDRSGRYRLDPLHPCLSRWPCALLHIQCKGTPGRVLEQWRHIKTRASDALIAAGGTITHHHAVGRDHMPWYRKQRPALFGKALDAAKTALDPRRILNPGVLVP